MSFYLKVYDNFNYMEEDAVYYEKGFKTPEEALRRAKRLVELYFEENWKPGMDYGTVKAMYTMYGEDPVIFSDNNENVKFSAWNYAEQIAMPIVFRLELKNAPTQRIYQLIIKFVAEKHIDQKLPSTELPYLVHLSNVAMEILVAAQHSKDFNLDFALKVALLHDVMEDTSVTSEEISFIFGDAVLESVLSLTKNSNLPKEERMMDSLKRIKRKRHEVWAIKMADRITNLQPPPKDWTMKKRNEYVEEAILIYGHLHTGNPYLADRLKAMIEDYKGYDRNTFFRDPEEITAAIPEKSMGKIASMKSWKNLPINKPKRIDISLHFTDAQYSKLTRGLIPEQMEDKWFIFCEKDWLYFHRSWTGYGLFKGQLIKEGDGYLIKEFWAERDHKKYTVEDDNNDRETISFLIARGLLGIDVGDMYADKNIKSGVDSIKSWSLFGNLLFTSQGLDLSKEMRSALFGVAVGNAMGVPVEYKSREDLKINPITDMVGYGTYNLPPGTFSDDSSLTFCLAEAQVDGYDLQKAADNFIAWKDTNFWTPLGSVFDIGITTGKAIQRLKEGIQPDLAGGMEESENGNGSLMRILPLLFYIKDMPVNDRFQVIREVSSITHRHIRSVIACFYYLEFARLILEGKEKSEIYFHLQDQVISFLNSMSIDPIEISPFDRLLKQDIAKVPEDKIHSTGYVIHTLEAGIWCLLTTNSYQSAVLKAVNLGEDTDTNGAVTGGLAGLLYGFNSIPADWAGRLARRNDIEDLAIRLGLSTRR